MSRDGNGTYSLPEAPFVFNTVIDETAVNNNFSDIGSALTQSLAKDGQTVATANLPMGNFKHTGVGNGTARNHYASVAQVQDGSVIWGGTAGGAADALTLNLSPAITAYAAGMSVKFIASADSTSTTPTISINSVGAVTIVDESGDALVAGKIVNGRSHQIVYDGANFRLSQGDLGSAAFEDVAAGGTGDLLRTDGDGSGLTGIDTGYPPGFVYNALVSVNSTDTEHDLDIQKFSLRNDDNDANIDAASALVKQMDTTFAEGTNAGGMASGESLPTSGFFYVFAVTKDSDGTVDVMGDTSSTGANVNTGWTVERILARVSTDASDNIQKVVNFWSVKGDWRFDSDEISIVQSGTDTVTHLLGTDQIDVKLLLLCKTSQNGYLAGEILDLDAFGPTQSATASMGAATEFNDTDITVVFASFNAGVFYIPNKTNGNLSSITAANWRVILRARQ